MRAGLALAAVICASLAGGAPAAWGAEAASLAPSLLVGEHTPNEANNLDLSAVSGKYRVGEVFISMFAGPGCVLLPGNMDVDCEIFNVKSVAVNSGGGKDSVVDKIDLPAVIAGGEGPDDVSGGPADDNVAGNGGNDTISGNGGNDTLSDGDQLIGAGGDDSLLGNAGDDLLQGGVLGPPGTGAGGDVLDGGPGIDTLDYSQRTGPETVTEGDGAHNDGEAGEGDDVVNAETIVLGAAGDVAVGAAEDNTLEGRGGGDALSGSAGGDRLLGGDGDDSLDGGAGGDTFAGGRGFDTVTYAGRVDPVAVTVGDEANDGAAGEGDDVQFDVEAVLGGTAADRLSGDGNTDVLGGGPGDDEVDGAAGDDRLDGGAGADRILGGSGDDAIEARDGNVDTIRCGTGEDTIAADSRDDVGSDCERLQGGAADRTGPRLRLPRKLRIPAHGPVRARISCPASETNGCSGVTARLKPASRPKGKASRAGGETTIPGGKTGKVTIKVGDRLRETLRSAGRATLSASARDSAGNAATTRRAIVVVG